MSLRNASLSARRLSSTLDASAPSAISTATAMLTWRDTRSLSITGTKIGASCTKKGCPGTGRITAERSAACAVPPRSASASAAATAARSEMFIPRHLHHDLATGLVEDLHPLPGGEAANHRDRHAKFAGQ